MVRDRTAFNHLASGLSSRSGELDRLPNLSVSSRNDGQSSEVDTGAATPPGVRNIEVKHGNSVWAKLQRQKEERENGKVTNMAQRIRITTICSMPALCVRSSHPGRASPCPGLSGTATNSGKAHGRRAALSPRTG